MAKAFYIKERNNPQLKQPYYVALGQLTKKDAKANTNPLYGSNRMVAYHTEQKYKEAIEKLKSEGFSVNYSSKY